MAAGDHRAGCARASPSPPSAAGPNPSPGADDAAPLIAQAVIAAVHTLGAAVDSLPPVDDPDFTSRVTAILADLRQARSGRRPRHPHQPCHTRADQGAWHRPPSDRRAHHAWAQPRSRAQCWASGCTPPAGGTNLTIAETAQAAGVSEDDVARAEAEEPVPVAFDRRDRSVAQADRLVAFPGGRRGWGSARQAQRRSR